jgi:hypothetical protein
MSKVYLISSLHPLLGFKKEHEKGLPPGFFNPLSYANLVALLVTGLLIHEVNVVLFLILVSVVPESTRLCMILIGQCMLQELVSVRNLLPVQLIPKIWHQTCKS